MIAGKAGITTILYRRSTLVTRYIIQDDNGVNFCYLQFNEVAAS